MNNTNVEMFTLTEILTDYNPNYTSDRVGTDFELISISPFAFSGMKS